jgi:hypothetical protein
MHWRDLPWGYIARFTFVVTWMVALVIGAVFELLIWLLFIALGFAALFLAHLVASASPDYQDFRYKVKLWRENGGGR